ncbi:hypothetical protein CANCADRAFT_108508 [Tortispora caseinolytica NRRL Y-17796]|uniref:Protein DOM34 homolog n=1 Tax=Tortispora caseinolytica NRRL Y-17796 TaxID=767744 RepID=A0A1E4TFT9_9ASCO|nr:hypothetical protein CANCADRAFT_108508 [Tortispora caseinolytica NRRL Y-17796]
MKLLKKDLEKHSSGTLVVVPEDPEDMWQLYNLIRAGDVVKAKTERKVVSESSTGSVTSQRVVMNLAIRVVKSAFDGEVCELHLNGQIVEANQYVKLRSFHTLDIEANKSLSIYKDEWDQIDLETINNATNIATKAQVGAVALHEGLAHVCLLTEHLTVVKGRLEVNIPRKRRGSSEQHDKSLTRFYDNVFQMMRRIFDLSVLKVIIIASPGFVGQGLLKRIETNSLNLNDKEWIRAKEKILIVHTSTGHLSALNEALKTPEIVSQLADTQFAQESRALDRFMKIVAQDDTKAWYGPKEVTKAVEVGAVDVLLISDTLLRSSNTSDRKKYVQLVEDARLQGGSVMIFSSMHDSGKQLDHMTGIAAILKYSVPDLEEQSGSEDDE